MALVDKSFTISIVINKGALMNWICDVIHHETPQQPSSLVTILTKRQRFNKEKHLMVDQAQNILKNIVEIHSILYKEDISDDLRKFVKQHTINNEKNIIR